MRKLLGVFWNKNPIAANIAYVLTGHIAYLYLLFSVKNIPKGAVAVAEVGA
ncbi:hypothetical protein J4D99_05730 [Siccationidurans ginsengisoli]|uniref:hypothetical protein n=1 Tax=Hymenobacter TaxID=89966 RepID=UPI001AADB848|nr:MULTISPECIES: hypothetical protein [unclassified Hymenobacter]MBO2030884.1 hypothetical protein [Hymenobacter sp. BT559]